MTVKITGLTANNVAALRETLHANEAELTATTATFPGTAQESFELINNVIANLPGRGHPRASLYAVARKLRAHLGTPEPVAKAIDVLCPNPGVEKPHRLRSVCKACGKEGAVTNTGTLRAHKPQDGTQYLESLLTL